MEVEALLNSVDARLPTAEDCSDELELRKNISNGSLTFDDWASLISEIETKCPDNTEKLFLVYDSFLSEFPLCHEFWRKYADYKMRLCDVDKVVEVFEQAVLSATYSVDVWVDYCQYALTVFEDPDDIRRLFKRAISFVGKDYLCHTLWDKYIEFEFSRQNWSSLANIYLQTLRFPTKKLQHYYDSFKKLVSIWEEEVKCDTMESKEEAKLDTVSKKPCSDGDITKIIKEVQESSDIHTRSMMLQKYKCIGENFYKDSCILDEKISSFESYIHSPYFHVKPLEMEQLENWHQYLDFAEKQGDFDWIVKLYERCLIPAAHYPEFWIRYVEYMESKGGRELANFALDRATRIFLKNIPVIHIFNSRYKEQIGDTAEARSELQFRPNSDTNYVDSVIMKANIEKRLGNSLSASDIYKEAIDKAKSDEKLDVLPALYIHYSHHLYVTTKSDVAARDVLVDAIEQLPNCKLLYEELVQFVMMHGGREHIDVVERVISTAVSSVSGESDVLNAEDSEHISNLFLKYVDLCGTISDVRKAWNQHMKMFPHLLRTKTSKISTNGEVTHHHSVDHASEIPNTDPIPERSIETSTDQAQQKEIVQLEQDKLHDQELNPPSLATLNLDPTRPPGTVLGHLGGGEDEDSGQPCKTFAECNHQSNDEYRRHDHYNSTEPQPKWWNRTDNPGRHRRDPRFRSNGGQHPRRRSQQQVQLQSDNRLGNQSSASASQVWGQNYNFSLQTQVPAQSSGEIVQNGSSEAYSLQMWQYYYYYYQQQQVAIQQQLQQLQVTQSQLPQQQEEQNPQYQQVLQQIYQLQQQQQQIYQLQQQLYQQYQQQQGLEQGLSQEQLLLYMQQQQQMFHHHHHQQQQTPEQMSQVHAQHSQELQLQQHGQSGVETDKKEVEEIAAAHEEKCRF